MRVIDRTKSFDLSSTACTLGGQTGSAAPQAQKAQRATALPFGFSQFTGSIVLEFVYGMLISLAAREGLRLPRSACLLMVFGGFAAIAATYWFDSIEPRAFFWGIPASLIVAGCALAERGSIDNAIVRAGIFLGDCSYSLYLVHPVALSFPRHLGLDFARSAPAAYCAFIVVVAVACGIAVHLLYDRPIVAMLKAGMMRGGTAARAA